MSEEPKVHGLSDDCLHCRLIAVWVDWQSRHPTVDPADNATSIIQFVAELIAHETCDQPLVETIGMTSDFNSGLAYAAIRCRGDIDVDGDGPEDDELDENEVAMQPVESGHGRLN